MRVLEFRVADIIVSVREELEKYCTNVLDKISHLNNFYIYPGCVHAIVKVNSSTAYGADDHKHHQTAPKSPVFLPPPTFLKL